MTTRRAAAGWRSTRASRRRIAVAWAAAIAVHSTAALGAPDPTQLTAEVHPPRAFGHQVGDLLSGSVTVHVPDGLTLDATSLPQPGARGRALELRRVEHGSTREAGGTRLELTLDYQVFLSPRETGTIETSTLGLRFEGRPREQTLRIEGWPVTVAPLVPVDVSPRRGLGEMQPDDAPPSIDTGSTRLRLVIEVGVLLLLLGWLAQIYIGLPWGRSAAKGHAGAARGAERDGWRSRLRSGHRPLSRGTPALRPPERRTFGIFRNVESSVLCSRRVAFRRSAPRRPGLAARLRSPLP